ncbi:hypothetical protein LguiB_016114 [Lonicera macranthoides]
MDGWMEYLILFLYEVIVKNYNDSLVLVGEIYGGVSHYSAAYYSFYLFLWVSTGFGLSYPELLILYLDALHCTEAICKKMIPIHRRLSSSAIRLFFNLRPLSTKSTKHSKYEWNNAWELAWLPDDLSAKNPGPWETSDNNQSSLVLPTDVDA